ncbi:MAG: hypothetical protein AAFP20_15400 [Cyanobacteria bacterium J06614_10]
MAAIAHLINLADWDSAHALATMTLPDDQTSERHERLFVWGYYTEANNDVSVGKALGNLGNGYQIAGRTFS